MQGSVQRTAGSKDASKRAGDTQRSSPKGDPQKFLILNTNYQKDKAAIKKQSSQTQLRGIMEKMVKSQPLIIQPAFSKTKPALKVCKC